jgi:hypothetical protein
VAGVDCRPAGVSVNRGAGSEIGRLMESWQAERASMVLPTVQSHQGDQAYRAHAADQRGSCHMAG